MPEVILPRTHRIGDYAYVVSRLIDIFASAAEVDELSLYRDLVSADRDVVRVRAMESANCDLPINAGVELIHGARDMILAAACSLRESRPVYRKEENEYKSASDFTRRMRLGQTEQGSFVVTLLTPSLRPARTSSGEDPLERRVTSRLIDALTATRKATERTVSGHAESFSDAVGQGASANLCDALVKMTRPVHALEVSLAWSLTLPMNRDTVNRKPAVVHFTNDDVPILRKAAQSFRDNEIQPDMRLTGVVQRLKRDANEVGGTITLQTSIKGKRRLVTAVLNRSDYQRAIQAHSDKSQVIAEGALESSGRGWKLWSPRIIEVR